MIIKPKPIAPLSKYQVGYVLRHTLFGYRLTILEVGTSSYLCLKHYLNGSVVRATWTRSYIEGSFFEVLNV